MFMHMTISLQGLKPGSRDYKSLHELLRLRVFVGSVLTSS